MRTLIFSGIWFSDPQDHKIRLYRVWREMIARLNPECDVLIVDNGSPHKPEIRDTDLLLRFPDSLGHFHHNREDKTPPKDGPGRGIMSALSLAITADYDRAAYLEADCLFARPVTWAFDQMTKPYACCPKTPYGYLDNNVSFFKDLKWLKGFDFIGQYDWARRTGDHGGEPVGEVIISRIFGDFLQVLPLRGGRASAIVVNSENFGQMFPEGIDFLTHADRDTYAKFLNVNGFSDLIEWL